MFKSDYMRGMEAKGPTPEQMERFFAAIDKEEEAPVKRSIFRAVLVTAALCAALTATALAASPSLREALLAALGSFEPYSQTVEGISVADQGIEVRAVSALTDGNVVRVYYEIQDLMGDRLDETLKVEWGNVIPDDGAGWKQWRYGEDSLVSYDPDSRTALMEFSLTGDGEPVDNTVLTLELERILPGKERMEVPLPQDVPLGGETLPCTKVNVVLMGEDKGSGRTVLLPGQTERELETEQFSLSSFGFGADGHLHILLQLHDGFLPEENELTCVLEGLEERNEDVPVPEGLYWEGKRYYDICYAVRREDRAQIRLGKAGWFQKKAPIEGNWTLNIPLTTAPSREVGLEGVTLGKAEAKMLRLTALGAHLETVPAVTLPSRRESIRFWPLTVYFSDGTTVAVEKADSVYPGYERETYHWTFPEPIDPEKAVGAEINGQYFALSND